MTRPHLFLLCGLLVACDAKEDPADSEGAGSTSGEATGSTSGTPVTTAAQTDTADDGDSEGEGSSGPGPADTGSMNDNGCGTDPGLSGAVAGEVEVDGQTRRFVLVVPEDYDSERAYPFLFMFHGRGSNGEQFRMYNGVEQAAGSDAILVYPDALPNEIQGGQTGWDLSPNGIDVAFMDRLLADFRANLCIDDERIFATGHSHGGFFSNAMGCARGETMRAIAPIAGGGPGAGCEGTVSAWLAHNPDDNVVPIDLGRIARNHWRDLNECSEETEPTAPDPCVTYTGCNDGYDVVWCEHLETPQGSPHGWPSFAGEAIWAFFSQY